jgi:hypothetical protein
MNANLSYMLSRVSSVSTQTFKLDPQNSTSCSASGQIRVAMPSNTLLSLKSIKMIANVTTGGSGARLPAKINSLIDRISLEAGGVTIDGASMQQYGLLCHAKSVHEGSKDGPLSHAQMVRERSYHNGGAALVGTANETYASANDPFCFTFDHTFLGSCAPSIIDTSLLPDMVLVLHLHGNEVLSSVGGPAFTSFVTDGTQVPTFALSNIRFVCEALALGSGVYDQLVQRKLADTGVLELPFKQYSTVIDTHNGSTRFHISCQSLDRIWAVFRPSDYADKGAPEPVQGHVLAGGFVCSTSNFSTGAAVEVGLPEYDRGGVPGISDEKYVSKYHDCSIESDATMQFQLNGSLTPGFAATVPDWLEISRNAVEPIPGGEIPVKSLDQFRSNYAVVCHRLTLPGAGVREIAGTDTRGINLSGSLNTTNVGANKNVVLYLEHTSVLQIGQNKQFAVVN